MLWWALYQAEGALKGSWLRRKALAECMRHIHYEARWGPSLSVVYQLVYPVRLRTYGRLSIHECFALTCHAQTRSYGVHTWGCTG